LKKTLALFATTVVLIGATALYEHGQRAEQVTNIVQPNVKLQDTYVRVEPPTYRERLEYQVSRGEIRAKVMEITAYSATIEDCGKEDGITASGEKIYRGVVAADPSIPFGTRLYIEGVGIVVVKDRGGAIQGDILDLYVPEPKDAKEWGRQKRKVYFLGKD
jgi:3D (Asp-Asp-Asp) domain-containing protein